MMHKMVRTVTAEIMSWGKLWEQLLMCADGADGTAVHNNDPVRILYRGGALGDDDFRRLRNIGPQGLPDLRVCFGVHGAGGVV
jgi:hypothetical protein